MTTSTAISIAALLSNAIFCAIYAERPDTFLITTAILFAALVTTINKGDHHG